MAARAKRLYLCNLIPLWESDDERLEVDWGRERAAAGTEVEMRVAVKGVTLDPSDAGLSIEFGVYESDFLLTGGSDDHILTVGSTAPTEEADDKYERRELIELGAGDPVPETGRITSIFLSPLLGSDGAGPGTLVRAYWRAEHQDDVSGEPEYYFDATVAVGGETLTERSDHELAVTVAGEYGAGLELAGTDVRSVREIVTPGLPIVAAAGWSVDHASPGDTVEMVAVVRGGTTGQRVSFEIVADTPGETPVLHRADLALRSEDLLRVSWRVPELIPVPDVFSLRFDVSVLDEGMRSTAVNALPELGERPLYGRLELRAPLRLQLVDAMGQPLRRVAYTVRRADDVAEVVAGGVTDAQGHVTVPDLRGGDYLVDIDEVAVLGAEEPEYAGTPPDPSHVLFSLVDVRLPRVE